MSRRWWRSGYHIRLQMGFHYTAVCLLKLEIGTKFEAFTVVKFQVKVFGVVTPSNAVVGYQSFRAPCCLHLQDES